MPDFPDIPPMNEPPLWSTYAFAAIVAYVVICYALAAVHVSPKAGSSDQDEHADRSSSFAIKTMIGLLVWLLIGAGASLSGLLRLNIVPPPGFIYALGCIGIGIVLSLSKFGGRMAMLPFHWLIGFHAFRFPLELLLHYWYKSGTIPVQMTYSGYNFDIIVGLLAIVVGLWAKFSNLPRAAIWIFNLIGLSLLLTVIVIAIASTPTPFIRFEGAPLLLPFYFPFNFIVSIAVMGALIGHLTLFRKLLTVPTDEGKI